MQILIFFYFFLFLHLISIKVTKYPVEISLIQKLSANNLNVGWVCGKHFPVPLGLLFFNVSAKWAIYCNPIRPGGGGKVERPG